MRRVLVLGPMAFGMAAAAGLLIYDSARLARIEQAPPGPEALPGDAGSVRIPIADQVQRQNRRSMEAFRSDGELRQNLENGIWRVGQGARQEPTYDQSALPASQPTDEMVQRPPLRGDFWRPGEFYNLMGRPNDPSPR